MPLSKFYKKKRLHSKDGYSSKCKLCFCAYRTAWIKTKIGDPMYIERARRWSRESNSRHPRNKYKVNPEKKLAAIRKYKDRYPEKLAAASSLSRKRRDALNGKHAHHWSYNKQHYKDVVGLSMPDHNFLHRHLIYDQPAKMYRRKDNSELLDTKEKHMGYFESLINKRINEDQGLHRPVWQAQEVIGVSS